MAGTTTGGSERATDDGSHHQTLKTAQSLARKLEVGERAGAGACGMGVGHGERASEGEVIEIRSASVFAGGCE